MSRRVQTIKANPDPVQVGASANIAWTGAMVRRVRVLWPSGTVTYAESGPGSIPLTVLEEGDVPIETRDSKGTIVAKGLLRARLTVTPTTPEPPPPPPPPPTPPTPTVVSVSPLSGATGEAVGTNITATFSIAMDAATITTGSFTLVDNLGASVAGAVTYDAPTLTATFNPTSNLSAATTYSANLSNTIQSAEAVPLAAPYPWSFTTAGATGLVIGGYAGISAPPTTGGAGGQVFTPVTYAQFKDAIIGTGLPANTQRIVMPQGSTNFDAGGNDAFNVDNDNLTIDWSNYHGSLRRHDIQFKCNNIIYTQARLRPGDQYSGPNDQDGITFNPGAGNVMGRVCVDHCSILWALDMGMAILNHVMDMTVQYCIIGAGLRQSSKPDNPKGLGRNITVPNNNIGAEATEHGQRITYYRNYVLHNFQRNLKAERASLVESINEVFYNWGNQVGHGNPRSINVFQNMYRKGNDTTSSRVWEDDKDPPGGYPASIYFPFASSMFENKNRTTFVPNGDHVGKAEERTTPNGGTAGVNLTVSTMTDALADAIVAAAGPTAVDSIDQALKDDWTNGTGVFYNGAGFPAPNPSWPAPF